MAKVKEIYVETTFTKSLPNYQNVKPTAGVTITVEPGDDVQQVYERAWELVGQQLQEQLALFEEEKKSGIKKGL